jgi:parvulin-like peptidyl-prolyl isomerase
MKIRTLLVIVAAVVVVAAAGVAAWTLKGTAHKATAVAATVNGDAILWSQVDAEVSRAAAQFGIDTNSADFAAQREEISKAVIDQLIASRLILQEAQRRNITATDAEVEEQIAGIRTRFPSEDEFTTALTRNGFTLASLREMIRANATQRRVAEAVTATTVTDAEIRTHFNSNRAQFDQPAQIKVSHILFRAQEKEQEPIAQAKARIAQARLAEGVAFDEVAKQYSDDKASGERGGDLGFVTKGTLVKEFEDVAWSLKPGETSGLVKTQYGLHIIKVFEVREAQQANYDRARDQIRESLAATKREKAFEAWIEQQRKEAKVERFDRQ